MKLEECYAVLGLTSTATEEEVKKQYKKKALQTHPDKNKDNPNAHKEFLQVSEAYKRITDPASFKDDDDDGEMGEMDEEAMSAMFNAMFAEMFGFSGGDGMAEDFMEMMMMAELAADSDDEEDDDMDDEAIQAFMMMGMGGFPSSLRGSGGGGGRIPPLQPTTRHHRSTPTVHNTKPNKKHGKNKDKNGSMSIPKGMGGMGMGGGKMKGLPKGMGGMLTATDMERMMFGIDSDSEEDCDGLLVDDDDDEMEEEEMLEMMMAQMMLGGGGGGAGLAALLGGGGMPGMSKKGMGNKKGNHQKGGMDIDMMNAMMGKSMGGMGGMGSMRGMGGPNMRDLRGNGKKKTTQGSKGKGKSSSQMEEEWETDDEEEEEEEEEVEEIKEPKDIKGKNMKPSTNATPTTAKSSSSSVGGSTKTTNQETTKPSHHSQSAKTTTGTGSQSVSTAGGGSYSVGDRVMVSEKNKGTVAYQGKVHYSSGHFYGIVMDHENVGKNDGSIKGVRYFTCQPSQGLMVKESELRKI